VVFSHKSRFLPPYRLLGVSALRRFVLVVDARSAVATLPGNPVLWHFLPVPSFPAPLFPLSVQTFPFTFCSPRSGVARFCLISPNTSNQLTRRPTLPPPFQRLSPFFLECVSPFVQLCLTPNGTYFFFSGALLNQPPPLKNL